MTFETDNNYSIRHKMNKKAQLMLTNPRDAKACKNCSSSTCFVWNPVFANYKVSCSNYKYL